MALHDVLIIGSGLYGISAARTYLEVHPEDDVIIFESDTVIGGTWSNNRIYPDFWTQTPTAMAEFSDCPMKLPAAEPNFHGFFPAKNVASYLENYVDTHVYNEKSIRDRILFSHTVTLVEKNGENWNVHCESKVFRTRQLIIASGMTSTPQEPDLPNSAAFTGPIIHHKAFGSSGILSSPSIQRIVVLGGGKSAADTAYACAKAGKNVTWIIRASGCGPALQLQAKGMMGYESSLKFFNTRLVSSFTPSVFARRSLWEWGLHGSSIGRWLLNALWEHVDRGHRDAAGYTTRKGNGFEKLESETPVFWQNDSSCINQRSDFFDTIANNVTVFRNDIASLTTDSVILKDSTSTSILADAIICATGWASSLSFIPEHLKTILGLPIPLASQEIADATEWASLDAFATAEILSRFPRLACRPSHYFTRPVATTPYRLYRAMAPISGDVSILILGHISVGNNFLAAEAQALWAVAYLDGLVKLPEEAEMRREVARTNAWCERRYLDKGKMGTFLFFDLVPYVDALLDDVEVARGKSWMKPVGAADMRGLVPKYIERSKVEKTLMDAGFI